MKILNRVSIPAIFDNVLNDIINIRKTPIGLLRHF